VGADAPLSILLASHARTRASVTARASAGGPSAILSLVVGPNADSDRSACRNGIGEPYGAKYPLMSSITCVGLVTNTLIAASVPAGTIAAFATTLPSQEFNVETSGCGEPAGHAVRKENGPSGTTVTLSE